MSPRPRMSEQAAETAVDIVDRLAFGGNLLETGTESYRLAHSRELAR